MKAFYSTIFAAIAACGLNANAATEEAVLVYDFEGLEVGTGLPTRNNPTPQADIVVAADPTGTYGNVMHMVRAGWDTYGRVLDLVCPSGFSIGNLTKIEVSYLNPSESPVNLDAFIVGPSIWTPAALVETTAVPAAEILSNEWVTVTFDDLKFTADGENSKNSTDFAFCAGFFKNPTEYYIGDMTFYFEKEISQREYDEKQLDKENAECVTFDFTGWDASHVGSNGYGTNRADMFIDKGPEGYDNDCIHVTYTGWTQIFIADAIKCPEGYTFDDLRLIEYDMYEPTTEQGNNGAPSLKLKSYYGWGCDEPLGDGSTCGNKALPTKDEWHTVQFYPSRLEWKAQIQEEKKDDEGNITQEYKVLKTSEERCEEFGKRDSFNISVGPFPVNHEFYVDNVKCYFQKSKEDTSGIAIIEAEAEAQTVTVYNLQGVCVLKGADKAAVNNLPAGLYIVNGKKVAIK